MNRFRVLTALCFAATLGFVHADAPGSAEERIAAAQKLADGLHYREGEIALRNGLAKINLPADFRYLDSNDAQVVLSKIWNNPDTGRTLGLIVPANVNLLSSKAWVVVIAFDENGYVKDNDAAKIGGRSSRSRCRSRCARPARNGRRVAMVQRGTGRLGRRLPRYDAAAHQADPERELRFDNQPATTLNYNIRMLGRRGVLVLNAVADMNQFAEIEQAAPSILSMVDFQNGHRYVDFTPGTDKVATYGLAALIAGGVLAKAGAFKGLLALLLAAKKFVIVALVAVGAAIKKFFNKLTGRNKSSDMPM